jgi:Domain of unknown function (DUF4279)
MHENKALTFLVVADFGDDAATITHLLGIAPSSAWVRGQQIPSFSPTLPPGVAPSPPPELPTSASLAEHFDSLQRYIDTAPQPPIYHDRSEWRLDSPLPPWSAPFEQHLGALLGSLEPHGDAVRRCSALYPTVIRCMVSVPELDTVLHLPPSLLSSVAQLGVRLDLELCFNSSDSIDDDLPPQPIA